MKILLDECTPRVVKKRLPSLNITTVQEIGWAGVKNGDLLLAADRRFDVIITTDKNLRHQQDLSKYSFAVMLLPTNQVPLVEALIPSIKKSLSTIKAGDFVEIPLVPE